MRTTAFSKPQQQQSPDGRYRKRNAGLNNLESQEVAMTQMIIKEIGRSSSMAAGGRRNFRISNTSVMKKMMRKKKLEEVNVYPYTDPLTYLVPKEDRYKSPRRLISVTPDDLC